MDACTLEVVEAHPPEEALDAVEEAAARVDELAAGGLELHFDIDPSSGALIAQLRTLQGEIVRRLRPSEVLDIMDGVGPF